MKIGTVGKNLELEFEWKICDFFDHLEDADVIYESPDFEFESVTWFLQLYPNGKKKSESPGWISFNMVRRSSEYKIHYFGYTFSIIDVHGDDYKCKKESAINLLPGYHSSCGWDKYLRRSKFLEDKEKISLDGVVVFRVKVDRYVIKAVTDPSPHCVTTRLWENMLCNMKDLFLKQKNCDITIRVKDQEFKAHRIILKIRCPFFAEMFEHDLKANRSAVVEITNAEPEDFRKMLIFLYCGEIEELSSKNVGELYALADKFSLNDLKRKCVTFLEVFLSEETVCENLYVADIYSKMWMKKRARNFLKTHRFTVLVTDKWKKFETENPLLAYETLKSIFFDKKKNEMSRC